MKKYLALFILSALFLSALTGCNRALRRASDSQQPAQPTTQDTIPVTFTSIPGAEASATQPAPTEIPTTQPTDTIVPTLAVSQSDVIANQLDTLLGQFNTQLQTVDTIPETP